ncbi:MAG TPA: VOC family protein [Candidatus Saccharimonadales bacterium]|nr:VOC family protein [Candidatus Saccharimonadales bacterium]
MQKITPFLWFDKNAEEAMEFYTSIFKDSKIVSIKRYPEGYTEGPMKGMGGKVLTGVFELEGQRFMALDGGPIFKFNEAISLQVDCQTQEEVDELWGKLSAVPESEQCGWLKDKYGLSWQIIPKQLGELISDPDPEKSGRVLRAMLKMKKIDIAELEKAHRGD